MTTSMQQVASDLTQRHGRSWTSAAGVTLLAVLAGYIGWMLTMPCFPSADGPVHMYYVHILDALLFGSNSKYMQYFRIRHLLPPYSLYYYALLVGSKFLPMLLADRLIVCFYFLSFTFGFRYLARALGPFADYTTLLATPLLLNWPLGMGFVNFCLSLSFAFWAVGLWLRIQGRRSLWGRVVFVLLGTAVMLTHPVPLLLLLTVAGTLLFARILQTSRRTGRVRLPAYGREDLLALLGASLNAVYVKLFVRADPFSQDRTATPAPYWAETVHRFSMYLREHALAVVLGRGAGIGLYRAALLAILFGCIALALWQRLRNRAGGIWTAGDCFLVLGGVLLLGLPFIPDQLNGLYFFADRLVLCVWLAFLLAASGWSAKPGDDVAASAFAQGNRLVQGRAHLPVAAATAVILFSLAANGAVLYSVNRLLRPAAVAVYALEKLAVTPPGQVGFVLEDSRTPMDEGHANVSWQPYYWAALHAFRHNDAILANAPWMDETILPVAPADALPEMEIPALRTPVPSKLLTALADAPGQIEEVLNSSTFFIDNRVGRPPLPGIEPLLRSETARAQHWSCMEASWYRICQRPAGQ